VRRVRNTEPRDLPELCRIAAAQNRRDGTSYPVPPIFEMNETSSRFGQLLPSVPLALTTERDGRVRQVHVFLKTIECMGFGGGREDMLFSADHIPMALDFLRRQGYDDCHVFIPGVRVSPEHHALLASHGMARLDQRLAHFFRTL
jgi:hypothetical protein